MILPILLLAAIGHVVLWVGLVSRAHGLGWHRHWVDLLTLLCGAALVAAPPVVGIVLFPQAIGWRPWSTEIVVGVAWAYVILCIVILLTAVVRRWNWSRHPERRGSLVSNHTTHIDVARTTDCPLTAPGLPTWLSRLPGNEVLTLRIQEKRLVIPRLSSLHEGVRIAHISDLHMSGRITRAYFERVVEEVNRCEADIVAITGDVVERHRCLDWIPDTLGRLRAKGGVYFVLGNHDRLVGRERLTRTLEEAGLTYLGGSWRAVAIRSAPVVLAGNELPWFTPAAELKDCPPHDAAGLPLRILLAHSPDQLGWARDNDIDLMLAGHLHGGQVCLPGLGAILAPSFHGVRYASGTFRAGDTVLHVCRGTSSLTPLRWNCPPEIAVLKLCSAGAE